MSYKIIITSLIAIMLLMLGACNALERQAEINERASVVAAEAAESIDAVLTEYGSEDIEDSELVDAIRDRVPESIAAQIDDVIETGQGVRASAEVIRDELRDLSPVLLAESERLRSVIATQPSTAEAIGAAITSGATSVGGVIGMVTSVLAVWYRRREREALEISRDIVTSIDAGKRVDTQIAKGFDGIGGAAIQSSMSPRTQRLVRSIRSEH